jgi:hypothetical protein
VRCAAVFTISFLSLVGGAVTAPIASADPAEGVGASEGIIRTQETNCFETGDRRPVLLADADAYVPDRYTVIPMVAPPPPAWTGAPGAIVAAVGFQDYVCAGLSVNGHAARPTIVSLGVVAVRRDGVPVSYILWVGTDNPLLFARLQQLGVETFFIPQSTYTETTNLLGQREITVDYVSRGPGGLDYTRNLVVVSEPALAPVPSVGTFYHLGSRGEVRFSYANLADAAARARICFDVADDSLPLDRGITDFCFPALRTFFRGSWTGTIQLIS